MATKIDPDAMPVGDYAIVEALGHRTLVGRVQEVERFGVRMLQIEQLYQQWLLEPTLLSGQSLYQFTPCSPRAAWDRRAKYEYELQGGLAAAIEGLPGPEFAPAFLSHVVIEGDGDE